MCCKTQVHEHVSQHQLGEKFQSAYKSHHSTETAIVKVKSDILENISKKKVTALILLDLSAAFDTVDHQILLDRLKTRFGISGIPLKWFQDYLTERHQQIVIDGSKSEPVLLKQGVPQGSVLGPLCFTYYTAQHLLETYVENIISSFICMQMIHNYICVLVVGTITIMQR